MSGPRAREVGTCALRWPLTTRPASPRKEARDAQTEREPTKDEMHIPARSQRARPRARRKGRGSTKRGSGGVGSFMPPPSDDRAARGRSGAARRGRGRGRAGRRGRRARAAPRLGRPRVAAVLLGDARERNRNVLPAARPRRLRARRTWVGGGGGYGGKRAALTARAAWPVTHTQFDGTWRRERRAFLARRRGVRGAFEVVRVGACRGPGVPPQAAAGGDVVRRPRRRPGGGAVAAHRHLLSSWALGALTRLGLLGSLGCTLAQLALFGGNLDHGCWHSFKRRLGAPGARPRAEAAEGDF
jgi:hypothetical protein